MFFTHNNQETEVNETMALYPYLKEAISAHNGTSYSPERRGKYYVKSYSDLLEKDLATVRELGGDEERYKEKFISLWRHWMGAKSRCISSMITGPSNFPTRRADKLNNWERSASDKLEQFRHKAINGMRKRKRREEQALINPIDEAQAKAAKEEKNLELMKAANKIVRSKKMTEEEKVVALVEAGWKEGNAKKLLEPDWYGRLGFASYALTNCRNRMKQAQARVEELKRREEKGAKEVERPDGINVVENFAENRLQVFFPDKPDADTRKQLKSNGFRWAPSNGCWQSYLNENAKAKLHRIIK